MKRIYIILSVAVLLVTLNGCSNQKKSNSDGQDNNKTIADSTNDKNEDVTVSNTDAKETESEIKKEIDMKKDTTDANFPKTESSVSTNKDSENTPNYEISEETYSKENIKITYPQIRNFNDSKKSDLINKILKDQALAVTNYYDVSNSNAILNVSYDIQLKNSDNLSIVYKGDFNSGSSAYPVSIFYTTNIDIKKGENIGLKDYANVDEIFKKLRDLNKISDIATDQELAKAQTEYLLTIDDSTLKDMLANADSYENNGNIQFPSAFSYRNSDNIIIAISVPHALGDYAEFLVKK